MKIYLAGAIAGIPERNRPLFAKWERNLIALGHEVFNPVLIQYETRRDALTADIEWICKNAEAIAFMPGWEHSLGARAEHAVGVAIGLQLIYLGEA